MLSFPFPYFATIFFSVYFSGINTLSLLVAYISRRDIKEMRGDSRKLPPPLWPQYQKFYMTIKRTDTNLEATNERREQTFLSVCTCMYNQHEIIHKTFFNTTIASTQRMSVIQVLIQMCV